MEDYHRNTLITQSMLNTLSDPSVKELVAQVGMDAYQGYDADYGAHHDDASFTNAGDPSHIQQDQVEFGEDDWLVSVAAAERDTRSCFYCFKVGHILNDCIDLKNRVQPHRNSIYHPANKRNYNQDYSGNTNTFKGTNSFRGNFRGMNYTRSSTPFRAFKKAFNIE